MDRPDLDSIESYAKAVIKAEPAWHIDAQFSREVLDLVEYVKALEENSPEAVAGLGRALRIEREKRVRNG